MVFVAATENLTETISLLDPSLDTPAGCQESGLLSFYYHEKRPFVPDGACPGPR